MINSKHKLCLLTVQQTTNVCITEMPIFLNSKTNHP